MSISVAVLPPVLRFTPDESKQILTLFNANDFSVKFKVSGEKRLKISFYNICGSVAVLYNERRISM